MANLAWAMDLADAGVGRPSDDVSAELRALVPAAVSRARGIDSPPSRVSDEQLNHLVLIESGAFMMGSGGGLDAWKTHRVNVSAFSIQEHEVTYEGYSDSTPDTNGKRMAATGRERVVGKRDGVRLLDWWEPADRGSMGIHRTG